MSDDIWEARAERDEALALLGKKCNEIDALQTRLAEAQRLCAEQAEDEGLWFVARTAPESYLQEALRKLHHAIERDTDSAMNNQECKNCRFYSSDTGHCRRYPPQVNQSSPGYYNSLWAEVSELDWCGEWQPTETVIADPTTVRHLANGQAEETSDASERQTQTQGTRRSLSFTSRGSAKGLENPETPRPIRD